MRKNWGTNRARHSRNCLCNLKTWAAGNPEKYCDCEVGALRKSNAALLEALEAIRELAREDVRGPSLVEAWFDEFDALMPQVDAALALAKGTEKDNA